MKNLKIMLSVNSLPGEIEAISLGIGASPAFAVVATAPICNPIKRAATAFKIYFFMVATLERLSAHFPVLCLWTFPAQHHDRLYKLLALYLLSQVVYQD